MSILLRCASPSIESFAPIHGHRRPLPRRNKADPRGFERSYVNNCNNAKDAYKGTDLKPPTGQFRNHAAYGPSLKCQTYCCLVWLNSSRDSLSACSSPSGHFMCVCAHVLCLCFVLALIASRSKRMVPGLPAGLDVDFHSRYSRRVAPDGVRGDGGLPGFECLMK